jgi:hypothetical protein
LQSQVHVGCCRHQRPDPVLPLEGGTAARIAELDVVRYQITDGVAVARVEGLDETARQVARAGGRRRNLALLRPLSCQSRFPQTPAR